VGSFSEASGFGFGFGLAAGTDGPQNGDNLGSISHKLCGPWQEAIHEVERFLSDGLWKGGFSW
jgi:hypothetical protein